MPGEVPPPAEEPGGGGETQSRFAHRNGFEVEDDDEESGKSEYETEDEDQKEEKDEGMDILANNLDKLKGISSIADPWTSTDPWQKEMIPTMSPTLTHTSISKTSSSSPSSEPSDATIKFEEALKNTQKIGIIGKLKEKREDIETLSKSESRSQANAKRKSEEAHQPSTRSATEEDGQEGTPGRNR